jgi:hypothetical protein
MPMDSIACPDPENNGEVCPDTLPGGIAGIQYESVATILPPPELEVQPGVFVPLHHITLADVQNLPPGITYQSNSPDNVFMVGTYYCILLSGIPTMAGTYVLKIMVDVYAPGIQGSPPIYLGQKVDSTSLSIKIIWNPNAIDQPDNNQFRLIDTKPNPFCYFTRIGFYSPDPGQFILEIYDSLGQIIYCEELTANSGENFFVYNGSQLNQGIYYYSVSNQQKKFIKSFIKNN